MIPRDYVTAWREQAPWISDHQVEQDLVVSRALVEIFRVPDLARRLAFRGGTALYKLHMRPAARYSEDIDLVQVTPEPIGDTFDAVRVVLDPWLGRPRRDLKTAAERWPYTRCLSSRVSVVRTSPPTGVPPESRGPSSDGEKLRTEFSPPLKSRSWMGMRPVSSNGTILSPVVSSGRGGGLWV